MQVRIYKPTKSPVQSGTGSSFWMLEFVENPDNKFRESLMGRTSSTDMNGEIKMKFPNLEQAVSFAKKEKYDFEIIIPKEKKLIKKSYASNFR